MRATRTHTMHPGQASVLTRDQLIITRIHSHFLSSYTTTEGQKHWHLINDTRAEITDAIADGVELVR
jgi:hypothetical protein